MASLSEDVVGESDKDGVRSKSVDSRGSSISSEIDSDVQKGKRRRSKESKISEERSANERISKAIEEEDAFLDYIKSLPAMSTEKVEAYKKTQTPVFKRSTSEVAGGIEHLENLYRLMEHLGQLRIQNSKLQERVKYLEHIAHDEAAASHKIEHHESETEDVKSSKSKRSTKCKSSHYGIRQTFLKSSRARSRSVGVEEIMKSTNHYRLLGTQDFDPRGPGVVKAKVSKWTKVKEAFRWEKASNGVLPEAKSQDSGLGAVEDVRYLRVPAPHASSDHSSSFSVSPADSVLSGQDHKDCLSMPHISSSPSTSDEDMDDSHFHVDPACSFRREGVVDPRRSKSLDGESHLVSCELLDNMDTGKDLKHSHASHKGIKTPWSKMKDIIQTRTGSIKKKKEDSDVEEDVSSTALADDSCFYDSQPEFQGSCLGEGAESAVRRRLAPMLTITLPSTEELRGGGGGGGGDGKVAAKPPPSPQADERHLKTRGRSHEEPLRDHGPRKISGGSAGTSPPSARKLSKWSKVKNAFLTSAPASEDVLRGSSSVPSSPCKAATFSYDIESDELSSGEFIDDNLRDDDVFPEAMDDISDLTRHPNVHAEIQRNYEELQLKLSQEFHKKLCEWERKKSAGSPGTPPCSSKVTGSGFSSATSSTGDESHHDKTFRKKMEEWEKMKPASGTAKHRESVTLQNFSEDNLSADFKKKLEEWEKIKSVPSPQTPDVSNSPQPHFKRKITDWQLWKPGVMTSKSEAGISGMSSPPADLPEDFYKKLQEWERLKQFGASHSPDTPGNKTPSPNTSRRDCGEHKPGKSQHSPTGKKERDFGFQIKVQKSKSHHEVKELAWLEKELHKIEREKLRLERERDKYLEREARLEKLRRAIGANIKKQEILIPTSTGLFRFEGISQKFTRKLYEWEKARGIGPEASTFALLEPGYQPPRPSSDQHGPEGASNGSVLTRSKSMGSVVDLAALVGNQITLTHQPSSLSLTHMETLENSQLSSALRGSDELSGEEPQAVIVDVVDEEEETASPLEHASAVRPVYCYAPEEVTRLIDSSGSDSDKDVSRLGQARVLLQENMQLLESLQRTEDICRELEGKIDDVEDKLNETEKNHKEHLGNLVKDSFKEYSDEFSCLDQKKEEIKEKLIELESQQERLIEEGTTLQNSFMEHSEQKAQIAQDLVVKVKRLQDNITTSNPTEQGLVKSPGNIQLPNSLNHVQELTSQLLNLAEKLEVAVGERTREVMVLRRVVTSGSRSRGLPRLPTTHWPHCYSTDSVSSAGVAGTLLSRPSEDLTLLPGMLTHKLHELKQRLSTLTADAEKVAPPEPTAKNKLSIIKPDSPEVETTFVFNIAKKNQTQTKAVQDYGTDAVDKEERNEDNVEVRSLNAVASFTISRSKGYTFYSPSEQGKSSEENISEAILLRDPEKQKKSSIESEPELSNPLKTYFIEDSKEGHMRKGTDLISTSSDGSDKEDNKAIKTKRRDDCDGSGHEHSREHIATKKYKRSRHTSGVLERRCSRTNSKEENTDDEEENKGVSDPSTSKKSICYEMRYKKLSKSKHKNNDSLGKNTLESSESKSVKCSTASAETPIIESDEKLKPLSSPKCVSKRIKKVSKSCKDNNGAQEDSRISYNYCCKVQNEDDVLSQEMAVNVFVPTTRRIFSPVRKDSTDETSTVISYVVEEPDTTCTPTKVQSGGKICAGDEKIAIIKLPSNGNEKNEDNFKGSNVDLEQTRDKKEDTRPKFDFVMPPCWIIKQARAQSASPALQRKTVKSTSREKAVEKEVTQTASSNKPKQADNLVSFKDEDKLRQVCLNNNDKSGNLTEVDFEKITPTDLAPAKDKLKKCSLSSEQVENNRLLKKEASSIPSSLKLRSEAGFPPISPLSVRREMKVMKDTAPSIRMMIAKYNQRVHENKEISGTKSPDSGAQSPIAWWSPVAERRTNSQLDKYQEEVRRGFQNNCKKEFYPHARLGQVQKSASAGYIRPIEKGCSNDSINSKGEEGKTFKQPTPSHGILKSSSAGAIKTVSPLPMRRCETNNSEINVCVVSPSPASTVNKAIKPLRLEIRSGESLSQTTRINVSSVAAPEYKRTITIENNTPPSIQHFVDSCNSDATAQDSIGNTAKERALKIKKAKEEFLRRGCVGHSEISKRPSSPESQAHNERLIWAGSKARLSQISCDSESSYENVPMVLVSGKEVPRDNDGALLVKSASVGMINMDSTACSRLLCGSPDSPDRGAIPKSKSGILSRFRKARLKKNKDKEPKLETVSTLCMQSLVVDINKNNQASIESIPSTSKSCPASPVLHKKEQSAAAWVRNTRRMFKPKRKVDDQ